MKKEYPQIRLSNKVKIYRKKDGAYVVNRQSGDQQFYNETGAEWISLFDFPSASVDDVLSEIKSKYPPECHEDIANDFTEFVEDLIDRGYLVGIDEHERELKTSAFAPLECEAILNERLASAIIEVTERCNEQCVHCYLPESRKQKGESLSIDEIKKCIDELLLLGVEKVSFTGGEAMLHPNLKEAIRYAKDNNLNVGVLSNLTRLSPDIIDIMSEADDVNVQVSLYAVNEKIHDSITGLSGSCRRTKDAILTLRNKGVEVTASMAVMKENYMDVCNVMDFASANGVRLRFDYVMMARSDFDNSNLTHRMTLEETELFFRMILDYDCDFGLKLLKKNDYTEGENLNAPICYVAIDGCCIASNGDLYLCPSWQGIPLGNIKSMSLYDLWNNNARLTDMRQLTWGDIKGCAECSYRNFCCVCLARNYYENGGNMFTPTKETCEVAKLGKALYDEYSESWLHTKPKK